MSKSSQSTSFGPPNIEAGAADPEKETAVGAPTSQDKAWSLHLIRRGDAVRALPPNTRTLENLKFEVDGLRLSITDYMSRHRTIGLLILKNDQTALEKYGMGSGPKRRQTSYSIAKSITATLVGAALHDGAIGGIDDRCDLYLPQLRGSAYEGVTVRNLLRMCSGVAWSEDVDGQAGTGRLQRALASRRPGSILDLACSLSRAQSQGTIFNYSTVESCVLGAVVAAATSRPLADCCAETIYAPPRHQFATSPATRVRIHQEGTRACAACSD